MLRKLFVLPIRFYQRFISPHKAPCCRFTPSCSQYAIDAVMEWGVLVGFFMALWRIIRCNPFSKGGNDPVPINKLRRKFLEKRRAKRAQKGSQKPKNAQTEEEASICKGEEILKDQRAPDAQNSGE